MVNSILMSWAFCFLFWESGWSKEILSQAFSLAEMSIVHPDSCTVFAYNNTKHCDNRWHPQPPRPIWCSKHQCGFLHCGLDPTGQAQNPLLRWGGLSGQGPQDSVRPSMLHRAEDLRGDLHPQTTQQLPQVPVEEIVWQMLCYPSRTWYFKEED